MASSSIIPNPLMPDLGASVSSNARRANGSPKRSRTRDLNLRYSTVLYRRGELVRRSEWDLVTAGCRRKRQPGHAAAGRRRRRVTDPRHHRHDRARAGSGGLLAPLSRARLAAASASAPSLGGALAAGILTIGGQYLISALIGHPKKNQLTGPDYALFNNSQRRAPRPIRSRKCSASFMRYPNLASVPYSDWIDNRQHIYQLFCLGIGQYSIQQIRIAQTMVWENGAVTGSYPDLQIQIVPPGGAVTLFPGDVVTSTLKCRASKCSAPTKPATAGSGRSSPILPARKCAQIVLDLALPGGLFDTSDSGHIESVECDFVFQAQAIDDSGTPIGALVHHPRPDLENGDPRRAICHAHLRRAARPLPGPRRTHQCPQDHRRRQRGGSAGLVRPARLPARARQVYPNITMIAVRAAPTQGLNSTTASQFNVIATRKLPVWDPGTQTWSATVATRTISAAAA